MSVQVKRVEADESRAERRHGVAYVITSEIPDQISHTCSSSVPASPSEPVLQRHILTYFGLRSIHKSR